ncbi:TetR/AcrR family transcriptional regulator [Salipiger sp. P9]|uniref:TetR/AcrR family transcriptional regulator n=1 Tax=Salipiger pentaromativorans TaxID=2943193 RepID=UPI0021586497|nr:TetR/AcrR family transcriptional regulator [Salipiger pentaromativorans]MCR8547912.1 TetR/AcrR family transcriptional regulator [Salipiger pentaromativorans]
MTVKRASIGARRNPATETAILDAAAALLAERGIAGVSMEAVAKRARAGKATLYRWWPTRGALLMAVYRRQKQITGYPETGTLEGDVAAVLDTLFAHWRRPEGRIFRHIIAASQSDDDLREALEIYRQERLIGLGEVFERAAGRGELSGEVPVPEMARTVMAMAWLHLLVDRLDTDTAGMARSLVRGWAKPADG